MIDISQVAALIAALGGLAGVVYGWRAKLLERDTALKLAAATEHTRDEAALAIAHEAERASFNERTNEFQTQLLSRVANLEGQLTAYQDMVLKAVTEAATLRVELRYATDAHKACESRLAAMESDIATIKAK